MGADLFLMYLSLYVGITYLVGFLWNCLDCRIDDGKLTESGVHESLFVALIAPFWVPIRIVVEVFRLLRSILMWVFNELF